MNKIVSIILLVCFFSALQSCYYDKEELVYPVNTCDTTAMTYTAHIEPVINRFCYSCHAGAATGSFGINLDSYAALVNYANNGKLINRITATDPAVMMPKGGPRLSDCDISKIRAWINAGAPN